MKLLLDTHILLWAAFTPQKLSAESYALIAATENALFFSAVSLWEIVIKTQLGRKDFTVEARQLRRGLLDNGYQELAISSEHAVSVEALPPVHTDPFDRLLIAQAMVEGCLLITSDAQLAQYPSSVRKV